jgi:hypothetical protein
MTSKLRGENKMKDDVLRKFMDSPIFRKLQEEVNKEEKAQVDREQAAHELSDLRKSRQGKVAEARLDDTETHYQSLMLMKRENDEALEKLKSETSKAERSGKLDTLIKNFTDINLRQETGSYLNSRITEAQQARSKAMRDYNDALFLTHPCKENGCTMFHEEGKQGWLCFGVKPPVDPVTLNECPCGGPVINYGVRISPKSRPLPSMAEMGDVKIGQ